MSSHKVRLFLEGVTVQVHYIDILWRVDMHLKMYHDSLEPLHSRGTSQHSAIVSVHGRKQVFVKLTLTAIKR